MFILWFYGDVKKSSSWPQWLHSTKHKNISWPVLTHPSKSMLKLHFIYLDPNGKARTRIDLNLLTCVSHICTYTKSHFFDKLVTLYNKLLAGRRLYLYSVIKNWCGPKNWITMRWQCIRHGDGRWLQCSLSIILFLL